MNRTSLDSVPSMTESAEHALTIGTATYTMPRFVNYANVEPGSAQSAEGVATYDQA